MPKKPHRVAPQRSRLSRKKRASRGQPRPPQAAAGPESLSRAAQGSTTATPASPEVRGRPRPVPAQAASRAAALEKYRYVPREIRRIGILSAIIVLILIVLAVFLR